MAIERGRGTERTDAHGLASSGRARHRRRMPLALAALLAPLILGAGDAPPPEVQVMRDLPYASGRASPLQSLDLYVPPTPGPHPVLVYVHGGGWLGGDKSSHPQKGEFFARQGFLFASVNHRLWPRVRHPTHVKDVAAAIGWLRRNASRYGGDPDRIFVSGHSSGGHLAALVVADARYLKAAGVPMSAVRGVVLLDGAAYDLPREIEESRGGFHQRLLDLFGATPADWRNASPCFRLTRGLRVPPFLLFYTQDRSEQSQRLARALTRAGGKAEVVGVPDKDHFRLEIDLGAPGDGPTARMLAFLQSPP